MAYYGRGDYYRGDYYRGDPFSLKGVLRGVGRAVGTVARVATNLGIGGPGAAGIAAVANTRVGGASGGGTNLPVVRPVGSPISLNEYGQGAFPLQPTGPAFGPSFDPGPGGVGPQGQIVRGTGAGVGMCTTKGYHLNKAGYFRRTPGGSVIWVEAHSACVRNRRMNPANGNALRRALRRATAFKKLAMKSIRLVDAGRKPKKFGGFKTKRSSR